MAHDITKVTGAAFKDPEALDEFLRALCAVAPDGVVVSDAGGSIRVVSDRAAAMFGYTPEELLGSTVEVLVPRQSRDLHSELRDGYVDDPVPRLMGEARDLYGIRKDGSQVPVDISLSAIESDEGVLVVSMVRDITPRIRLLDQLRREQGQLRGANVAARAILAGEDTDAVLRIVISGARQIVGAHYGALLLAGPRSDEVHVHIGDAPPDAIDALAHLRIPLNETLVGDAVASGRSLLLEQVGTTRWASPLEGGIGPAVVAPVPSKHAEAALLAVANPLGGRHFSRLDLGAVESAATQAAVALDFAAMRDDLRHLAVSEERDRIAMDIHDGIIQELFGTGMALQSAEARADDPTAVRAAIGEAAGRIDGAIADLRGYIYGLARERRDRTRFDATIRSIAALVRHQSALVVVTDVDPAAADAVAAHGTHVEQMVREALSNAARHANAATCRLKLRFTPARDAVILEVDDDGCGFDVDNDEIWDVGHGLGNLRKRSAEAGASLEIASEPGAGTTVRIRFPQG